MSPVGWAVLGGLALYGIGDLADDGKVNRSFLGLNSLGAQISPNQKPEDQLGGNPSGTLGTAPDGAPVYPGQGPGGRPSFKGEPGSWQVGPYQDRKYGSDGYPETDIDWDTTTHGQARPHAQDWGRPTDGSNPTHKDRGVGRSPTPDERFSEPMRDPQTKEFRR